MKRMICLVMAVMLAALCLTACGTVGGGKGNSQPGSSTSAQAEGKTVVCVTHDREDIELLGADQVIRIY